MNNENRISLYKLLNWKKTVSTIRLSSYSEERIIQCINYNLLTFIEILRFNIDNNFMFFRISSAMVCSIIIL